MTTVWSTPKQERNDGIANMEPRLTGETVSAEERDGVLIRLVKMVWAFQRSLAGQLSNMDNNAELQAKLYKNINPETAKVMSAEIHCPNCAMHEIRTSFNHMTIHF